MKKIVAFCMAAALMVSALTGCSGSGTSSSGTSTGGSSTPAQNSVTAEFDTSKEIAVISREEGSGTRGAFVELFGVEEKDASGTKIDRTTLEADITNSTSVMMTSVSGNPYAIGYISLGSLNNTVKALKIGGVEASVANIKNGTYEISRPFNIATLGTVSEAAKDFIQYILSAEGQKVVEKNGYIPQDTAAAYTASGLTGKIVIAGSSSVTPVMEKLKEAYQALNSGVEIEIQENDSTTGMNSAIDGICDIGMASRALKDTETQKGLTSTTIATDGIAVVVNKANPLENLTKHQVKAIYVGESIDWSEVA